MTGREIPPEAGKKPPFGAEPGQPDVGEAGSGDGYSGQEYDNAGQAAWRRAEQEEEVAPEGAVRGSGVGAGGGNMQEEYDADAATGGGERPREGD